MKKLTILFLQINSIRKRKAEGSPGRNDRAKRYALTNLTNNNENNSLLKQSDSDENLKKLAAFINKEEALGVRTRAAAAASGANQTKVVGAKAPEGLLAPKKPNEKLKNEQPADIVTVLKSRHSEIITKPAARTRRISNEFEKTEESLYVSALEDISTDASMRFSDAKRNISDIANFKAPSTIKKSHDKTFKPDSQDIYEDARDDSYRCERKLAPGVKHFDQENWNDPFQVSHYAMTIFDYLTFQERKYQIHDYIPNQPELSKWMRSLLIDWMVEVQESFELNHETLYLSVKIVDSYLGKEVVSKDALQLVGAAALLIACKYDVSLIAIFFFLL